MRALARADVRDVRATALRLALTCCAAAAFSALCARMSFRLPFTPVPVTLQVFAALLSGMVLGSRLGAASQMLYVAAGASGLPVFADARGTAAVLGPTGGYIVGFIGGAFAAGLLTECMRSRPTLGAGLGGVAGITAIYLCGTAWLAVWLSATGGAGAASPVSTAWRLGALPFIGVDVAKAFVAGAIALGAGKLSVISHQ